MRKAIMFISAFALVVTACGGGSDAGSCDAIAEDAIGLVQDLIDEIDSMTAEDLLAVEGDLPGMAEFETKIGELEEKADDEGCSDAEMEELFVEKAEDLTADSEFGQLMLEGFKEEMASGF